MTAPPRDLATVQDEFLAQLAARELRAVTRLLRLYAPVYRDLVKQAEQLAQDLADARAAGTDLTALSAKNQRIIALRDQIAARIDAFARQAEISTRDLQSLGVDLGTSHSGTLMGAALAASAPGFETSFTRLPAQALDNLVGQFADGSPLRDLFQTFGPDAANAAEQILFKTLATGQHPTVAARQLRTQLGVPATRAMAVARTELMRAYRTTNLQTYQTNRDVVKGWRWNAKLDRRTCAACWSRHGTVYPVTTPFVEHVSGRCVPQPVTMSWEELGFPPEVAQLAPPGLDSDKSGVAAFEALSPAAQRDILGPRKYELFHSGAIDLVDLDQETASLRWGVMHHEASIAQALANHGQRKSWLNYDPPPVPPQPPRVRPDPEGAIRSARAILARGPGWSYRALVTTIVQRYGVVPSLAEIRALWNQVRRAS